jgi:hypothetical protein
MLLFSVNGGDVGCGFSMGHQTGLFAMTYEIFQFLDGTHGGDK